MRTRDRLAQTWFLTTRLSLRNEQIPEQDVVDESGFSGAGNTGDTCEYAQWKIDLDVLEIVLSRSGDPDRRARFSS